MSKMYNFMQVVTAVCFLLFVALGFSCTQPAQQQSAAVKDPLDQWNEGPSKASIVAFMKTITDTADPQYLPAQDRVAVFDMDGTILLEKPGFVLFDFVKGIIMDQIATHPELKRKQPYKAFYEKDWGYFGRLDLYGEHGLYSILLDATAGYTEDQVRKAALEYFRTVKDQRYNKPYNQLVFSPIIQLIRYLQDNHFEVYIVSGSDPGFIRAFSEEAVHIPDQNVIGTAVLTNWIKTDSGSYFKRIHKFVEPINDETGKPVNILNRIGKIPVLAVGNSYGDTPMLEYSKNAPVSLQMIVNHDDSVREYYYEVEYMKKLCQEKKWQEISMKNDFKIIFQN